MIRKLILGPALTSAMSAAAYADKCVTDPNPICYQIYDWLLYPSDHADHPPSVHPRWRQSI